MVSMKCCARSEVDSCRDASLILHIGDQLHRYRLLLVDAGSFLPSLCSSQYRLVLEHDTWHFLHHYASLSHLTNSPLYRM